MAVREELFEWLSQQPAWQQELARRLASRTQLNENELQEAHAIVQAAFHALPRGTESPQPQAIAIEDLPDVEPTDDAPKLVGFGNMRGVGAIASDQDLQFAPDGLTVVYGPNAVGKTTYVRGLKRVCRAVDCENEILGNVFAPEHGEPPPSAKVELIADGDRRAQQLDLQNPANLGLESISVFDARCAELYVDAENTVAYVPSALVVLTRLAATQDDMRQELAAQIAQLEMERPSFPELTEPTEAHRRVASISADTDPEALRRFAMLDEPEKARLVELRALVAAAEANTARAESQAAQRDAEQARALAAKLRDIGARVQPSAIAALRGAAEDDARAKAAVALAAREFEALPVPGIGTEPWERLWRAARQLAETQHQTFPPGDGAHCPLCLQTIDKDVAARMAHFHEHIESTINRQADQAANTLAQVLDTVDDRWVTACRTDFLSGLQAREEQLHTGVERYLNAVARRMSALRADPAGTSLVPVTDDPSAELDSWAAGREQQANALAAATDPAREQEMRNELAELRARERLHTRLPDIEAWISGLQRIAGLRQARGALATNRLTSKQRELAERLISGTLSDHLRHEVHQLRCEHLPIDLEPHATVGQTQVRLRLAGARGTPKVSEILSEGEQRAVSLAFFLAEVSMSGGRGGIIVDDPVSSLDDSRREYIAERIVTEATHRQVIVLTHDIPFLTDVVDQAEKAGIQPLLRGMWRIGSQVGRIDESPPFATMNLKARVGVLDQEAAQWDSQEPPASYDEAWQRVCNFYERMRKTWERAVEERLFRGVVQRFQRDVKTKALADINITDAHIKDITDGMSRCSMFVHDAPPGTGTALPGRTELAADLEKLQAFERETRSRH